MARHGPLDVTLGIATSIGGFLEAGSIATAAQAGAEFRFQLGWAVALGTLCVLFLVEMSGRFAAVSRHTIAAGVRERFGFPFYVLMMAVFVPVAYLVLASEIGGIAYGLRLLTGVDFRWWALPVAFALWLYTWKGSFSFTEQAVSLLGLVTIAFAVAAFKAHPPAAEALRGLMPSLPHGHAARYWFIACSILGASVSPYLFYYYSAGAIEEKWHESDLGFNRLVSTTGMLFGGLLSFAVLVASAIALAGHKVSSFDLMLKVLSTPFGRAGFILFAVILVVACFGAAVEIALSGAYAFAQGLGWTWSKNLKPREAPRFTLAWTLLLFAGAIPALAGIDPLKLTMMSMAVTAASLPVTIVPFLVLMNDKQYVKEHGNHPAGNSVVLAIIALACVLALVTIPLQLSGGN